MIDGLVPTPSRPDLPREPVRAVPDWLRSHGSLDLRFVRHGARTHLADRRETGCLRVRMPRLATSEAAEAVMLNTSGGLCGGDTIANSVAWDARSHGLVSSQAAEKVYDAGGVPVRIATRLQVGAGAVAEWLPQETILFDGAMMERDTQIELADTARLVWCETLVFGRVARGETFARGALRDRLRVRREGRLIHADVLSLADGAARQLARVATGLGARASAMILVFHPEAKDLEGVREASQVSGVLAGASAWNAMLAARLVSQDPARLREAVAACLSVLRRGAPLPAVWRC